MRSIRTTVVPRAIAASLCASFASTLALGRALAGDPGAETTAEDPTPQAIPAPEAAPVSPPLPPPPPFVEHLGAAAYPGDLRGLYAGSLWLEPSFNGLQWPYMPRSGVGLSGSAWVDSGYEQINRGFIYPNTVRWLQQGRATIRVTPTYSDGSFFVQAQAELIANKGQDKSQSDSGSGIVDVDDLWVRFGRWNGWDIKLGRFEAWELFHTGMGLDINTLERRGATQEGFGGLNVSEPQFYGVTYLHDRPSGEGVGNIAFHAFPSDYLRFEVLGQLGVDNITNGSNNSLGARPAVIYDIGWLKLKAGAEYVRTTRGQSDVVPALNPNGSQMMDAMGNLIQVKPASKFLKTQKGLGGAIQLVFNPQIELGGNFGIGQVYTTDLNGNPTDLGRYTTISYGGFANWRPFAHSAALEDVLLGVGVIYTQQKDLHRDSMGLVDKTAHLQGFFAAQYLLMKQLYVKAVLAYARSDFDQSFVTGPGAVFSDVMMSGRLRFLYLF